MYKPKKIVVKEPEVVEEEVKEEEPEIMIP